MESYSRNSNVYLGLDMRFSCFEFSFVCVESNSRFLSVCSESLDGDTESSPGIDTESTLGRAWDFLWIAWGMTREFLKSIMLPV